MTSAPRSDDSNGQTENFARGLLLLCELAIIGAGVVLLFAADGRWWVIVTAALMFVIGLLVGAVAVLVRL